jgi:hypothetical protein
MSKGSAKGRSSEIVIFSIARESECSDCGHELWKGEFLRMEKDRPLCLACADLNHLSYLPRGDAALTRRANKYSALKAVVVRFSRSRNRYERQGILGEEAALERAEKECLEDADSRERARERAAERREAAESEYVAMFAARVAELYPGCAPAERIAIAMHACSVGSGRIGRSVAAKGLETSAIELAVRAHVRHVHTAYDKSCRPAGSAQRRELAFTSRSNRFRQTGNLHALRRSGSARLLPNNAREGDAELGKNLSFCGFCASSAPLTLFR